MIPKKPPRLPKHYLVYVSSRQSGDGFWAIRSEELGTERIISRSRHEAQLELDNLLKPEPRIWKPSLADQIDQELDKREKAETPKAEPKVDREKRGYHNANDKISDPPVKAILTGVTCPKGRRYYRDGQPFMVAAELAKISSRRVAQRLLDEAWAAGVVTGIRPQGGRVAAKKEI